MSTHENVWSRRKKAAINVRAKVLSAVRTWLREHEFIEVQGPIIVPSPGERTDSFEVTFFGKKCYLAQGLGPYAKVLMANLGRIYTIAPTFRAEKVKSNRHLAEYWRIEADIPQCNLETLISIQEELIGYVCRTLSQEAVEEFGDLGRDGRKLGKVQPPFRRLTYDRAIEILQRDGFEVQWGAILEWEHEKHLSLRSGEPFFISEYPLGIETYFYESLAQRPELTLSVDLFAPEGYGEISSGGQPVVEERELLKRMEEAEIELSQQKQYVNDRKNLSLPYSGFAIGLERLTQWICKLEHIKEASAFPEIASGQLVI